jgi:hypothetical protein
MTCEQELQEAFANLNCSWKPEKTQQGNQAVVVASRGTVKY